MVLFGGTVSLVLRVRFQGIPPSPDGSEQWLSPPRTPDGVLSLGGGSHVRKLEPVRNKMLPLLQHWGHYDSD